MPDYINTEQCLPANTLLNKGCYTIISVIKKGGFGITYMAKETGYIKTTGFGEEFVKVTQPETVVIKELYYNEFCQRATDTGNIRISDNNNRTEFEKMVSKQLEEGKVLRSISHQNIVRTRDIFKENGTAYMVMDYVNSPDLEEILEKVKVLKVDQAKRYIQQLMDALLLLHNLPEPILHLDVSPSNLLIDEKNDHILLIDFGASLTYGQDSKVKNRTSSIVTGMKRHYAPVEQSDIDRLKTFTASFDTYAVGATLYHLLTGIKPPPSGSISSGYEELILPSKVVTNANITAYLDGIIHKAMHPKFHYRYNSIEQMIADFNKEAAYIKELLHIRQLVDSLQYQDAMLLLENTTQNYLHTTEVTQLKQKCEQELEQITKRKEYDYYFIKGEEFLKANAFDLARIQFTKANNAIATNDCSAKIKICNELENVFLANQVFQQKITAIQQLITNEDYDNATLQLQQIDIPLEQKAFCENLKEEITQKKEQAKKAATFKEIYKQLNATYRTDEAGWQEYKDHILDLIKPYHNTSEGKDALHTLTQIETEIKINRTITLQLNVMEQLVKNKEYVTCLKEANSFIAQYPNSAYNKSVNEIIEHCAIKIKEQEKQEEAQKIKEATIATTFQKIETLYQSNHKEECLKEVQKFLKEFPNSIYQEKISIIEKAYSATELLTTASSLKQKATIKIAGVKEQEEKEATQKFSIQKKEKKNNYPIRKLVIAAIVLIAIGVIIFYALQSGSNKLKEPIAATIAVNDTLRNDSFAPESTPNNQLSKDTSATTQNAEKLPTTTDTEQWKIDFTKKFKAIEKSYQDEYDIDTKYENEIKIEKLEQLKKTLPTNATAEITQINNRIATYKKENDEIEKDRVKEKVKNILNNYDIIDENFGNQLLVVKDKKTGKYGAVSKSSGAVVIAIKYLLSRPIGNLYEFKNTNNTWERFSATGEIR
jgi:serine/threonine protein kinase